MHDKMAKIAAAARRHLPISRSTNRRRRRHRPRQASPLGVSVDQVRRRLYTPSARARSPPSTRRPTTTRSSWKRCRNSSDDPTTLDRLYRQDRRSGTLVPLGAIAARAHRSVPLTVNHQGQLPVGDHLVQPRARFSLGEAVDAIRRSSARISLPAIDHHRLPGHGAGVPGFAAAARACCCWRRSSSSTSCSAFCTRASSTRITILSGLPSAGSARC